MRPLWPSRHRDAITPTEASTDRAGGRLALLHRGVPLAVVLLGALLVRTWDLGEFPSGLHGDEAISMLLAHQVWHEGGIGVYTELAAGQPTLPIYPMAVPVALFGPTVFAVRLVPALFGVAGVAALYSAMHRPLGERAALVGAGTLALLGWHVHYSRTAFPGPAAWTLVAVASAAVLDRAARRRDWRWWALAGALGALGPYVYNAHPAFAAAYGLVAVAWLVAPRSDRWAWRDRAVCAAAGAAAGAAVALPMVWYARGHWANFSGRFRRDSRLNRPEWADDGWFGHVGFLVDGWLGWWRDLVMGGHPDHVDALGQWPVVPWPLLVVAVAGVAVSAWRFWREPVVQLGWAVLLLIPFASVLTVDAASRRTVALAPFLAMFAGVAIAEDIRLIRGASPTVARTGAVVLVALGMLVGWQSLHGYFGDLRGSDLERRVFAYDMVAASQFMDDLPGDRYVLFAAERFTLNHETRQALAPEVRGEDRSEQFGQTQSLDVAGLPGEPVWVLMGSYRALAPELEQRYPDGTLTEGRRWSDGPTFVAYELP